MDTYKCSICLGSGRSAFHPVAITASKDSTPRFGVFGLPVALLGAEDGLTPRAPRATSLRPPTGKTISGSSAGDVREYPGGASASNCPPLSEIGVTRIPSELEGVDAAGEAARPASNSLRLRLAGSKNSASGSDKRKYLLTDFILKLTVAPQLCE